MSIFTVLDPLSFGLFEFNFGIGSSEVPPGYNYETFDTYSNIILTFDTIALNGY